MYIYTHIYIYKCREREREREIHIHNAKAVEALALAPLEVKGETVQVLSSLLLVLSVYIIRHVRSGGDRGHAAARDVLIMKYKHDYNSVIVIIITTILILILLIITINMII